MSLTANGSSLWYAATPGGTWAYNNHYYLGGWMNWDPQGGDVNFGYGSVADNTNSEGIRFRHVANDVLDPSMYVQAANGGSQALLGAADDGAYDIPENGTGVWIQWLTELRLRSSIPPAWYITARSMLYTPGGGAWLVGSTQNLNFQTDYEDISHVVFAGLSINPTAGTPGFDFMSDAKISDLYFINNGTAALTAAQRNQLITKAPHLVLGNAKVPGYWRCDGSLANYAGGTLGTLAVGNGGTTAYDADGPQLIREAGGPRHVLATPLDVVRGRPPYLRPQSLMR